MMAFVKKILYFRALMIIILDVSVVLVSGQDLDLRNESYYDQIQNISNATWSNEENEVDNFTINNNTVASHNNEYDCRDVVTRSNDTFTANFCGARKYSCKSIICDDDSRAFVRIRPFKYQLKYSENCKDEYLEICERCQFSENGSLLTGKRNRYCGRGMSDEIISQVETIIISIQINWQSSDDHYDYCKQRINVVRGQYFDYNPECGGIQMGETGLFTSPGYPMSHLNDGFEDICFWEITVPIGQVIHFEVTDGSFDERRQCNFQGHFGMWDGVNLPYPRVKLYNETNPLPSSFTSNTNSVQFKLFPCHESFILKIVWKAVNPSCNITMDISSGVITSPNFPNVLYSSVNCWWKVIVNPGNSIRFTFLDWTSQVAYPEACNQFFFTIVDGVDESGNSIGKWCADGERPTIVETTTNSAMVLLKTFSNGQVKIGFRLSFEAACLRVLEGFHGKIESLGVANFYPPKAKCPYTIESASNSNSMINSTHFHIKGGWIRGDFLEILERDNPDSETWLRIGILNDWDPAPTTIIAQGRSLRINFQYITGFQLERRMEGCGSEIRQNHGIIQSPDYPKMYPPNLHCQWKIVTSNHTRVALTVHKFDIEIAEYCKFDGLKIYDSNGPLANLCGQGGSVIKFTSDFNTMYLEFHSDKLIESSGFTASFSSIELYCGGIYSGYTGYIYSPHYPNNYNNFDDCTWFITVDPNYKAALKLLDYDIEMHPSCIYDSLTIYDGHSDSKPQLGKYCGKAKSVPNFIIATENLLMVKFLTDRIVQRRGFKAKYFQICGAVLRKESGIIKNPDYMSITDGASNCNWTIQTTHPTSRIAVVFTNFSWPVTDPFCDKHNVIVYDGEKGMELSLLYMGCCSHVPPPLLSTGNVVTLQITNAEELRFQAFYFIIPEGCKNASRSTSDSLYTFILSLDTFCITTLTSDNHQIFVSFRQYQMISRNRSCDTSFVEVYSSKNVGTGNVKYCRAEIPSLVEKTEYWIVYFNSETDNADVRIETELEIKNQSVVETNNAGVNSCVFMYQHGLLFQALSFLFNRYMSLIYLKSFLNQK